MTISVMRTLTLPSCIVIVSFVVLLVATPGLCSGVYYVTPHPNTPCPAEPCLTLSHYVQESGQYFNSNTTFVFLPGDHSLDVDLALEGVTNVTLMGYNSSLPNKIKCTRPANMKVVAASAIKIVALAFVSCGKETSDSGAIHLVSARDVLFSDCIFRDNAFTAVSVYHSSSLTFNKVTFENNSKSSLRIFNSNVSSIRDSTFSNNSGFEGGAVAVFNSTVNFSGTNIFASNTGNRGGSLYLQNTAASFTGISLFRNDYASEGGSLYATSAHLDFEGETSFIGSSAFERGGGIFISASTANFYGNCSFINDSAWSGGGINVRENTIVIFNGNPSFINCSGSYGGGGISAAFGTTVRFVGECSFIDNSAAFAGGGLLTKDNSTVSFDGNCKFVNNSAKLGGGVLAWGNITLSFVGDYEFINNSARSLGGVIWARSGITVHFNGRSNFINNSASAGGAISAQSDTTMSFDGNCSFINNSANYGGGMLTRSNVVINFHGTCNFINNSADYGGGIIGISSTLNFYGMCSFINNSASRYGGGLALYASVYYLFQHKGSRLSFTRNYAQRGGAITVFDSLHHVDIYCSPQAINLSNGRIRDCFFQIQICNQSAPNVSLVFQDNSALEAGDDLYGGTIDYCHWSVLLPVYRNTSGELLDLLAPSRSVNKHSTISSDPFKVCVCDSSGHPDCNRKINVTSHPGKTFTINLVAVGQRNGTVPAVIQSTFEEDSAADVRTDEMFQNTNETCTTLHYTVFSNATSERLNLYTEGPCGRDRGQPLTVLVELQPCPDGFELSTTTKACICDKRLQTYTNSCDINSETIFRDDHSQFWVGYDNETRGLILHPHCPFDYCRSVSVNFTLTDNSLQCSYNRSGILCGRCQSGLSLALGTSRCLECSSAYLALLIPFVLAGLLLVFFLQFCKFTVAVGAISGLIFYANIVAVNQSSFFPLDPSNNAKFLNVFIAWLNLDLGIETCFYDGMDAYAKTWLQFAFPIYIWALVGIAIVSSRYSPLIARILGTNPVAVLATLFLLSYTKILRTILDAHSFTNLQYPNSVQTVWLSDGNISYLRGKHIPLFIAALAVFFVLFLPYTLALLLGQYLQARSNWRILSWVNSPRFKTLIDAYHGPYSNERRYWPGLLLVVRCILLLIFSLNALSDPSVNLLAITACTLGLVWLVHGAYKNWYLEVLEVSFFLNLGILSAATLYVRLTGGSQAILAYVSISVAFTEFIAIVAYQMYLRLRETRIWKRISITTKRLGTFIVGDANETEAPSSDPEEVEMKNPRATVPTTVVTICRRESLIYMETN